MPPVIDLRSDTVTHPTEAMRRAMASARVGDDVFGDDPTVNELEARAAALLGKEAGLFVASGTMGNLVSLMAHLPRGYEAIAGEMTHTVMDEAGGHAVVVGATIRALRERPDGTLDPAEIESAFRDPTDVHEPITGLVILENTHAHSGVSRCRSRTWNASQPSRTIAVCPSMSTAPASSTRPSRWASPPPRSRHPPIP